MEEGEKTMQRIAFFGLGTMGIPIVKNLLKAGYVVTVTVHNGHRAGPDEVAKYGAYIVDTVEQAVKDADVIMSTCLMTPQYGISI